LIPAQTDNVKVENNISAESTGQFTVDENSLAKIMSVLTNLYTDPEGAVVREYLTNALDSQIEAQENDPNYVWRPIEVTTPSRFNKNYIVRDFGIGMSTDDINDIYSKYGKSTKESTNSQTGMLGLGSKCALTYTGQFTITGYKNGIRTRAIISKNEENIPIFQIVDTRATTEPNGVEISVPVRDSNSFHQKTADFLRWWKDGQVLVDGKEPDKHGFPLTTTETMEFVINGNKVSEKVEVYAQDGSGHGYYRQAPKSYVVMGNVPYAVSTEYISRELTEAGMGFVAYVPMGSVVFPPSREELTYTSTTKNTLKIISAGLFQKMYDAAVQSIVDAIDHADAWRKFQALPTHFKNPAINAGLKYDGLDLTIQRIDFEHTMVHWDYQGHAQITERKVISMADALGEGSLSAGAMIVTGFDDSIKPTAYFKKKLRHWINVNGNSERYAIMAKDDVDSAFLSGLNRVTAEHIKAIKLPKNPSQGPREETPYEYYYLDASDPTAYNGLVSKSEVKIPAVKGKTMVYCSPQDYKETYRKAGTNVTQIIKVLGDDYMLVVLGKNRFEKFLRTYTKAIPLKDAMKAKMDSIMGSIKDAEAMVSTLDSDERDFLKKVDVSKINDPELVDLANVVKGNQNTDNYRTAQTLWEIARRASVTMPHPEIKEIDVADNPAKRYPLIEDIGARRMDHLIVYINAVWEQQYKK
jgi:hypothetical protein